MKVFGVVVLALLSMYFIPQMWYVVIALLLTLILVMVVFIGVIFMAKALGIAVGEWAVIRWLLKRSRT